MTDQTEPEAWIRQIRDEPSRADADDIDQLLAALTGEDAHRRRAASLALTAVSREDPASLADRTRELAAALDEGPHVRGQVAQALADVAGTAPERVAPVAGKLRACLGIDADVTERSALRVLTPVADVDADVLSDLAPDLRAVVQRGSNLEESLVRALLLLSEVLPEAPDTVRAVVPDLLTLLKSLSVDNPTVESADESLAEFVEPDHQEVVIQRASARKLAAVLLARVAAERPDAVKSHAATAASFLDDSDLLVRKAVVDALHSVGAADPAALTGDDVIRALARCLRAEDQAEDVRGRVAAAFGAVTVSRSDATADEFDGVVPPATALLKSDDADVRLGAAKLLASVAAVDPEAAAPAAPELRARLSDENSIVRARALWALRDLRDVDAKPIISELADDDPNPDVRTLACETLTELPDLGD